MLVLSYPFPGVCGAPVFGICYLGHTATTLVSCLHLSPSNTTKIQLTHSLLSILKLFHPSVHIFMGHLLYARTVLTLAIQRGTKRLWEAGDAHHRGEGGCGKSRLR